LPRKRESGFTHEKYQRKNGEKSIENIAVILTGCYKKGLKEILTYCGLGRSKRIVLIVKMFLFCMAGTRQDRENFSEYDKGTCH